MKKLIFFLLIASAAFGQSWSGQSTSDARVVPPYRFCFGPDNGSDACGVQAGSNIAKFTGFLDFAISAKTVATLPPASLNAGRLYRVTDGQSASDCLVGSGSTVSFCVSNGTAWTVMGSGGGGSGNVTGPISSASGHIVIFNNTLGTLIADSGVSFPLGNASLQNNSVTVNTGSGLSGGGSIALGSSISVALVTCPNGQLLQSNGATWSCATINGTPGGSSLQVQYNNGGNFGGTTCTWNSGTGVMTCPGLAVTNPFQITSSFLPSACVPSSIGTSTIQVNNTGNWAISNNGGPCIEIPLGSSSSFVFNPTTNQHGIQPSGTTADFNSFANIRYVTPTWNWQQNPGGNLSIGSNTINLAPCPVGIDTNSAGNNYVYQVYISGGTGTAESVTVTGGTCTSGASSGTIVATTGTHTGAWTVGSSTQGIQEAWNDAWINDAGTGNGASSLAAPYVKLVSNTQYNLRSTFYMRGRGGKFDGNGALIGCYMRNTCIYIGTTAGHPAVNGHWMENVLISPGLAPSNQWSNVQTLNATSGTYTIGSTGHHFVVGDTVDCEVSTEGAYVHLGGTIISTGFGANAFEFVSGSNNITDGGGTFGWCHLANWAIEDNSDHVVMQNVTIQQINSVCGNCVFGFGIANDNDQALVLNGFSNRASAVLDTTYPVGAAVYQRTDNGSAGIVMMTGAEITNINCFTGGNNGLMVDKSVCQGFPVFGFRYFGGLQPANISAVYEDVPSTNPLYGYAVGMGYLLAGGNGSTINSAFPIKTTLPIFNCIGGGAQTQRNYYATPYNGSTQAGPQMYIGSSSATNCSGVNVPLVWPQILGVDGFSGVSTGAITWDVAVTTGAGTVPPLPGATANFTVWHASTQPTCTNGMCSFTDNQTTTSHTVSTQSNSFIPKFWFWPSYITFNGNFNSSVPYVQTLQSGLAIVSAGGNNSIAAYAGRCLSAGSQEQMSQAPIQCLSWGPAASGFLAHLYNQLDPSGAGPNTNFKGAINLGGDFSNTNVDLITLQDSNTAKTKQTSGERPVADANDMALGKDQAGGMSQRSQISISSYIGQIQDGSSWLERLTSSTKTFAVNTVGSGSSHTLTWAGNETFNGTTFTNNGAFVQNSTAQITGSTSIAGPQNYAAGGGTAQAQTVTLSPSIASLVTGFCVKWLPANANSGAAPTLSVNGTAATAITKNGTQALIANDLTTTAIAWACYDGTQYQLLNPQTNFTGGINWPIPFTSGGANMATANGTTYIGTSGTSATEANLQWPIPRAGLVTALYCNTSAAVAAGTYTMTVDYDGSAQALTCAITSSNTKCQDLTSAHGFAVLGSHLLDISSTVSGGPATTVTMNCSLLFQ